MTSKRICIYITYDDQAIVDEYIGYMLSELKKNCEYLVVICNYPEIKSGKEMVEHFADQIFFRDNFGFDCGGFKDALCNYIGWDKLGTYDELVLVNDSFFGPFIPFSDIFTEMEAREVDFWGLIAHAHLKNDEIDISEHIQTFFLAVQSKMLHSSEFREYWEKLPYFSRFNDIVENYEHVFTEYFKNKGFTYSYLADTEKNNSTNLENNFWQYAHISYELIKKRKFPFLKKQQLSYDTLEHHTQHEYLRAIDYIDKYTDYDVGIIWKNIIRTLDPNDLYRNLHLNFIIDNKEVSCEEDWGETIICVNVRNDSAVEYVVDYLDWIYRTDKVQTLIYSDDNQLLKKYDDFGFNTLYCQSMKAVFKIAKGYDYICLIHDYDLSSQMQPSYIMKSHFFNIWGNLIGDYNHVNKIIELLRNNKFIGILMPPVSNYGIFFNLLQSGWGGQFNNIQALMKKYNINCIYRKYTPPFAVSDNLWLKKDVICKACELSDDEIDLLQYIWIYLAQSQLLLSGIVESNEYAAINGINLQKYLTEIVNQVCTQYGKVDSFMDMKQYIFLGAAVDFCMQYKKIYIYGTGYIAKEYKHMIPKIDGYVVSDGQKKQDYFDGKSVLFLSEVLDEEDAGIIICLDKKNQSQVIPLLEKQNFHNYICV